MDVVSKLIPVDVGSGQPIYRRAIFLDRDGTINRAVHHPRSCEELVLLPNSAAAIRMLRQAGWCLVVVTNQSVVARGYITENTLRELNAYLDRLLRAEGAVIDAWYFCPHHPEFGVGSYQVTCQCRKPQPGMLQQAARELNLELSNCVMIGDSPDDIRAGQAAGCSTVLVKTGDWEKALDAGVQADYQATDLLQAAEWVLSHFSL